MGADNSKQIQPDRYKSIDLYSSEPLPKNVSDEIPLYCRIIIERPFSDKPPNKTHLKPIFMNIDNDNGIEKISISVSKIKDIKLKIKKRQEKTSLIWYYGWIKFYEENYLNGKKHGECKFWYEDGQIICKHMYENGKTHGLCQGWYRTGKPRYIKKYEHGIELSSIWWDENGKKRYEKTLLDDGKETVIERYNNEVIFYEETHINGHKQSRTEYDKGGIKLNEKTFTEAGDVSSHTLYKNGNKFKYSFLNNKLHGTSTEWDKFENKILEYTYANGKIHGVCTKWYANGNKNYEHNYEKGFLNGVCTDWYANGKKKCEYNYEKGVLNGVCTEWYENGNMSKEYIYKNIQIHGLYTEWYENGNKKNENNYKNGKKHGVCTSWYENGNKKIENNYENGVLNGMGTEWYENGNTKIETNYKNDHLYGQTVKYYDNKVKQKKKEYHYYYDVEDGVCTEWYENGNIKLVKNIGVSYMGWYEDGQIEYEYDKLLNEKSLFTRTNFDDKYKDGKEHIICIEWYKYNSKKHEIKLKYENGNIHISDIKWYENGQKESEVYYMNGRKNGVFKNWLSNGDLNTEHQQKKIADDEPDEFEKDHNEKRFENIEQQLKYLSHKIDELEIEQRNLENRATNKIIK